MVLFDETAISLLTIYATSTPLLLFKAGDAMPSTTIDLRASIARATSSPGAGASRLLVKQRPDPANGYKRTLAKRLSTTLAAVIASIALSGCGTFCGGAVVSGGGFAGGCGTGVRF